MARYVESAVLQVIDRSSAPLNQIEARLRAVHAAALNINRLGNLSGARLGLSTLSQEATRAEASIRRLNQVLNEVRRINSARIPNSVGGFDPTAIGRLSASYNSATSRAQVFAGALNQVNAALSRQAGLAGAAANAVRGLQPPRVPVSSAGAGGSGGSSSLTGRRGFSPNASLQDRAQNRIVGATESNLKEGIDSSGAARDYGLMLFPKNPEIRAAAEAYAKGRADKYKSIPLGMILKTWYETAANVKNPMDPALGVVVDEVLAAGVSSQMQGNDRKKSTESLAKLAKALNLRGDMTKQETGDIDAEQFSRTMQTVRQAINVVGKELPPEAVFQAIKYARNTRGALDQDMLLNMLVAAGDIGGSSAGVGNASFVQQLMGTATKEAQAQQAKYGLIQGGIDPDSPAGPKKFKWESTTDSELLYSSSQAWIAKHFMAPGGILAQMGLDPKKASQAQIAAATKPMFSNRVAHDFLVYQITQFRELETRWRARNNRPGRSVTSLAPPTSRCASRSCRSDRRSRQPSANSPRSSRRPSIRFSTSLPGLSARSPRTEAIRSPAPPRPRSASP